MTRPSDPPAATNRPSGLNATADASALPRDRENALLADRVDHTSTAPLVLATATRSPSRLKDASKTGSCDGRMRGLRYMSGDQVLTLPSYDAVTTVPSDPDSTDDSNFVCPAVTSHTAGSPASLATTARPAYVGSTSAATSDIPLAVTHRLTPSLDGSMTATPPNLHVTTRRDPSELKDTSTIPGRCRLYLTSPVARSVITTDSSVALASIDPAGLTSSANAPVECRKFSPRNSPVRASHRDTTPFASATTSWLPSVVHAMSFPVIPADSVGSNPGTNCPVSSVTERPFGPTDAIRDPSGLKATREKDEGSSWRSGNVGLPAPSRAIGQMATRRASGPSANTTPRRVGFAMDEMLSTVERPYSSPES